MILKHTKKNVSEKEIKNLILNIKRKDDEDLAKKVYINNGMPPKEYLKFKQQSRLFRFETAFNNFFDILRINSFDFVTLKINFQKNGRIFEMINLSSGEKQIVVRGASILKNLKNMDNGVILVDEPENSMHPKWAKRILNYYKNLVTIEKNQISQIIVATHSEFVLESALDDPNNTIVIILKDDNGVIKQNKITGPFVLPTLTSAEVNYEAFHIASKDYHNQLYGYFQELKGADTVTKTDEKILKSTCFDKEKYYIESSYGKHHYKTLPTYIRNAINHPDNKNEYSEQQLEDSIRLLRKICSAASKKDRADA